MYDSSPFFERKSPGITFFVYLYFIVADSVFFYIMSKKTLYFFSPSHKRGFFILFLIVFLILIVRKTGFFFRKESPRFLLAFPDSAKSVVELVYVNSADSAAWEKLPGIGQKLSARIVKYREKIGGFTDLNQISEVYGLKPETYTLILPYLKLDSISPDLKKRALNKMDKKYSPNEPIPHLNINTATAEDFEKLPGIGAVLSERIVKYRDSRRAGFQTVTDIQQVYGISQETFDGILPYLHLVRKEPGYIQEKESQPPLSERNIPEAGKSTPPKTSVAIDLNTAAAEELQTVPGIGEKTAIRILELRNQIGGFANVEHLRAVWGISEENYQKMKPLLKVSPLQESQKKSLNYISAYDLCKYPFMQKEPANRLVTYRKLNGYFNSWEDVAKAEGVTPEMLVILKDYFILKK